MMSSGPSIGPRWCVAVLACVALITASLPASAAPQWPALGSAAAAEPFGMQAMAQPDPTLLAKWRTLARETEAEQEMLALCAEARERCTSQAALRLLAIADEARSLPGRARLGVINRAINLLIRFAADTDLSGPADDWSAPLATLQRGAGDCEDYALAKLAALRLAGVESDDLRLVIVHDDRRGEDHALAAARLDGHWLILDNRKLVMLEDDALGSLRPIVSVDALGIWRRPGDTLEPFTVASN